MTSTPDAADPDAADLDAADLGAEDDDVREGTVERANGETGLAPGESAAPHRREGQDLERHGRSAQEPDVPIEQGAPEPTARPEPPETG